MEYKNLENMNKPWSKSIMEMYPEYAFTPTSQIKRFKKSRLITNIVIGSVLIVIGILLMYWFMTYRDPSIIGSLCGIPFACGGIMVVLGAIMLKNKVWLIAEKADYISKSQRYGVRGNYNIFVKNNKFGVCMLLHAQIVIPAEYDNLSWLTRSTLTAVKDGRQFIIDIYGKVLS